MNSVLIAVVIISAILNLGFLKYLWDKGREESAIVSMIFFIFMLVIFNRTITGMSIGIIVSTAITMYLTFYTSDNEGKKENIFDDF